MSGTAIEVSCKACGIGTHIARTFADGNNYCARCEPGYQFGSWEKRAPRAEKPRAPLVSVPEEPRILPPDVQCRIAPESCFAGLPDHHHAGSDLGLDATGRLR